MALTNAGFSAGALGGYAGQSKAYGGRAQSALRGAGLAYGEGLRGSKADEFLAAIATNTRQMATQGVQMDVGGAERFIGRMRTTFGAGNVGMYGPQAATGLMGAVGGARNQVLGPFAQLGQSAVLMRAMQGSNGTLGGLISGIEGMNDPQAVLDAISGMVGGGDIGAAAVGSMTGLPQGMAGGLLGGGFGRARPSMGGVPTGQRGGGLDLLPASNVALRAANEPLRAVMGLQLKVLQHIETKMAEMLTALKDL